MSGLSLDAMDALRRAFAPEVVEALEELIDQRVAERVEEAVQHLGDGESPLLTYEQAGRMLGCSPAAVHKRAIRKRLELRHHGRRAYVTRESVLRVAQGRGRGTL